MIEHYQKYNVRQFQRAEGYESFSRALLSVRPFCDDGDVLYPHRSIRWPLATCGYWAIEMWLVEIRNRLFYFISS